MAWLSFLKKPAWQARDPAVRAQAVAEGTESELLDALPRLAAEDPDPGVRAAALSRIDDPVLLAERLRTEPDPTALGLIRKRLGAALAGHLGSAELGLRIRLLGQCASSELLERLAVEGREADLRRAALERIEKVGFLAERAMHDPDPELRLMLVGRLPLGPALERVADYARLRDKRLYRAAKARLESAALERRTAEALVERARALCQEAESIARGVPADGRQRLVRLDAEWRALADDLPAELHTRFFGALQAADRALDAAERARRAPSAERAASAPEQAEGHASDTAVAETVAEAEVVRPHPGLSEWLAEIEPTIDRADEATLRAYEQTWRERAQGIPFGAAERELRGRFQRAVQRRRAQLEEHRRSAAQAHAAWVEKLGVGLRQLEDGQQAEARATHAELRQALDAVEPLLSAAERKRWLKLNGEISKLNAWLVWSNAKQRARLCDELEALIGRGLHPDALATAWKEAQQRWQELDRAEGLSAEDSAALGISKRFRAIGHRLLQPAREFFDKRDELRQQKRLELERLLEHAAAETENAAPAELVRLRRELVERLRRLDELDPRQRAALGRRLRERIARISARLTSEREQVAAAKRRYLARLERELKYAEPAPALALAKQAQKEWATLGRAERAVDQALTEQLQRLIEPHFERVRDAQEREATERERRRQEAEQVLVELESLDDAPEAMAHRLEVLASTWRALGEVDPKLERRFRQANERAARVLEDRRRARQTERRRAMLDAAAALDRIAAGKTTPPSVSWPEGAPDAILEAHRQRLLSGTRIAIDAELRRQAAAIVLKAEYLAGLPAPEAARQERLDEQMRRLAERMAGKPAPAPGVEFDQLLAAWLALPPEAHEPELGARLAAAVAAFRD